MHILLSLFATFFAAINTISVRVYQNKLQIGQGDLWGFQASYLLVGCLIYFVLSRFAPTQEIVGWPLAVGVGVCIAVANVCGAACYVWGPMSLTGIINNCSVILPVLVGCLAYHESLSKIQIFGMLFLLATLLISVEPSSTGRREISPRWYLYIFLTFLSNGLASVMMNVYSKLSPTESNSGFLAIAYLVASACLIVCAGFGARGSNAVSRRFRLTASFFGLVLIASMGAFASDALILWLNSVMPASLLYPLLNGATAVIVCITSCVYFKEKLVLRKFLAILTGIGAIVFLNL